MLQQNLEKIIASQNAQVSLKFLDLNNNRSIAFRSDARVPSASLIKVPILLAVLRQIASGQLTFCHRLTRSSKDAVDFSRITEMEQKDFSIEELLRWMIIVSDNTATNMLIDLIGMDSVNALCSDFGLYATSLERKMMDFSAIEAGRQNWTSAADMIRLLDYLHKGQKLFISQRDQEPLLCESHGPLCGFFFKDPYPGEAALHAKDPFPVAYSFSSSASANASAPWQLLDPQSCFIALRILESTRDSSSFQRYIPDHFPLAHKTGELDHLNHDMGIFYLPQKTYALAICVTEAVDNLQAQQLIGRLSKCIYDS